MSQKPKSKIRPPPPERAAVDPVAIEAFVDGKPKDGATHNNVKTSEDVSTPKDVMLHEPPRPRAVTERKRKEGSVRRTTIYLRLENFTRLKTICAKEDRDISSVVNEALGRYLDAKTS